MDKINLKCDVIDGPVLNGVRESLLYSFVLDNFPSYKVFSEPERIHFKKTNKLVLNLMFYVEDDYDEQANFNDETLTFTLQLIKI